MYRDEDEKDRPDSLMSSKGCQFISDNSGFGQVNELHYRKTSSANWGWKERLASFFQKDNDFMIENEDGNQREIWQIDKRSLRWHQNFYYADYLESTNELLAKALAAKEKNDLFAAIEEPLTRLGLTLLYFEQQGAVPVFNLSFITGKSLPSLGNLNIMTQNYYFPPNRMSMRGKVFDRKQFFEDSFPILECGEMVLFPVQLQNIPAGVMVFFRSYFVSEIISLLPMITNLLVSNHNRIQMEKKMAQMEAKEEAIFHSSKLISLGQLAAEMVHEINRPLTTLLGYSQLLLEDDLSEQVHGSIRKIKMDALRAKGIIQDLSFITKGHNDHQTNFNINDMIHVAAKLMKNPLALANITLDEQFDQTLPTMSGEPGKILQVVLNILQNAADAISETKNGGTIGIATSFSSDSRYVMVRITDNGPGIPEKILKRIGEPFITTKGEKGTGLGLALSMKIMEKMRGRLDISTREKHGTHVCIIVPFYPQVEMSSQNAKPYPGQSHQIRPERSVSSRRAQEQRIFVIDDEPTIIDLITKVFERIGYKVESSSCARDALENLKENDYDVITLDVKMPDMTGTELYTELAKIKPELRSRVLFLTGDIASSELEDFLNETGCAYLMKPFDIDDLNREVSDILKKNT